MDQLKEWHRYFDREQSLILKSEDFFARPSDTLELVLKFLGLSERDFELEGKRNEGGYSEPMDPETRRWLQDSSRTMKGCTSTWAGTSAGRV